MSDTPVPSPGKPLPALGSLTLFAALFVAAVGIQNGAFNQVFYLLDGIARAEPDFLASDWYTTQATKYHLLWSLSISALQSHGVLGPSLTVGTVVLHGVCALAIHALVSALYRDPLLPWAMAITLYVGLYTRGLGDFYLLAGSIEPFSIAGVAILAGLAFLGRDRPLPAGLAWGFAALMHSHFALLLAGVLGLVTLLSGWRPPWRTLAALWLPYLVLAAPSLWPVLDAAANPRSREIFEVLSALGPQHYQPWLADWRPFAVFAGCLALGAGGLALRPPAPRPLLARAAASLVAVVVAALLAAPLDIFWFVSRALPWRLSTHVELLGLVAGCAALAMLPGAAGLAPRRRVAGGLALAAGAALLAAAGSPRLWLALGAVGLAGTAAWLLRGRRPAWLSRVPLAVVGIALAPLAGLGLARAQVGVGVPPSGLYQWVRTATPAGSVFLVPPDWRDFRLNAARALIADWWAPPMQGADVIEWRRRLDDLSGTAGIVRLDAYRNAYLAIDCDRLQRLRRRYGLDYAILPADRVPACGAAVHSSDGLTVIRLGDDAGPGGG